MFRRSAEFYFTQQIKCQSLPDSGIDTAVCMYSLAGLHWIHELLQSSQHFAAFQAAVFIFSLSRVKVEACSGFLAYTGQTQGPGWG